MFDFEERLRTTVVRRSQRFEPSADLPDRIRARVHRRHVRRQLLTGSLAVATAAAAVAVVALVRTDGHDEGSIRMTDRDDPVTVPEETSVPSTTVGGSTSGSSTSSTTGALPQMPATSALGPLTPLSRQGIGPITAGMTLRGAQDAARVSITPSTGGSSTCVEAQIAGVDTIVLLVEPPRQPGADVMDGIVRAAQGSVLPTDEGAIVGQMRDELLAALGQPTRVVRGSALWGPGAELLVFEAGGYAYGALVVDDMVLGLQSGDPGWVSAEEGCPA